MKPDFGYLRRQIQDLQELDKLFLNLFSHTKELEEMLEKSCGKLILEQSAPLLADFPVDELKNSKAGIRTGLLEEAGYRTLYDLYQLRDEELCSISGIGEKQAASIRSIIQEFLRHLSKHQRIVLSDESTDPGDRTLLTAMARYRRAEEICRDAKAGCGDMHQFLSETIEGIKIRSLVHWYLSRKKTREETLRSAAALEAFQAGPQVSRARRFIALYWEAVSLDDEGAREDFRKNSASYYAILERLTGSGAEEALLYGSIPSGLASQISRTVPNLSVFTGDLRAYQKFGVSYILHQKKVLLGDEMGLGKTVQAIAVMAHLAAEDPKSHFLIICPASVMINWCREIVKFSRIRAHLLHGSAMDASFDAWSEEGGAAVTNYESMRKIAGRIDNHMRLALLVADEAHYIKNPEARRTMLVRSLEDESDRILLMTGTPLENRVDEMCELIGFLRPDMVPKIRENAGMSRVAAFREMLAPVYLRRQAAQVLAELPDVTEFREWCEMTPLDAAAYAEQVAGGNFMGMRRVSFLQDDVNSSSKAIRLAEICEQISEEGRKAVVYSYFRETVQKAGEILGGKCAGVITGSTPFGERQAVIDRFSDAPGGGVLLCQIQAGGTGLNIQAASVVIFCEPQIKPSLEKQAVARVHRMGQIRNVLVFHLLCGNTVDEAITAILEKKQEEFDLYADESVMADAERDLADQDWIRKVIEEERRKYLPAVIDPAADQTAFS